MPTVFTMIIDGDLPGRFVWRDDVCVAFLTINPTAVGHTLVVPRAEVDHWIDLDADLAAHLMRVSQFVGQAQQRAFSPTRIGQMIAGFEVPHVHLHLIPMHSMHDFDLGSAQTDPDPAVLDDARAAIERELRAAGHDPGV